jgi:hypothetical protein
VERIQSIRRTSAGPPSVERLAVNRRVDRHDPRDEEEQRRRRRHADAAPEPEDGEPAGPDADGHIDVSV